MAEEQNRGRPPKVRTSPVRSIIVLIVITIALIFFGLTWGKAARERSRESRPLEGTLPGTWQTDDSSSEVWILFHEDNTYEFMTIERRVIIGDWSITEDALVEAPIRYRNYDGVWVFEPTPQDELKLEVPELDIDWTFYKTD